MALIPILAVATACALLELIFDEELGKLLKESDRLGKLLVREPLKLRVDLSGLFRGHSGSMRQEEGETEGAGRSS